jgi:hypothetical protein
MLLTIDSEVAGRREEALVGSETCASAKSSGPRQM